MKHTLYVLFLTALLASACSDSNICSETLDIPTLATFGTYVEDINEIDSYLAANNLVADTTASGLRYVIYSDSTDRRPDLCDVPTVSYRGYFPNADTTIVFDSSDETDFTFDLSSSLVEGWREGMLLLTEKDSMTILMPSYLGYGLSPPNNSVIPENQILIFDIKLIEF